MEPQERGEWTYGPTGTRRWIAVTLLVVAVAAGGAWLATRGDQSQSPRAAELRPLPAFSLRSFEGGQISNQAVVGKPAVINFFASTCPFCIHEMPAFERVHLRTRDDVAFLGVALRDSEAAARQLAKQTGVTYPLAFDDTGDFYRDLRAVGMPVTVFVLADGRIALTHVGPLDEGQLQQAIDQMLALA